ncbi:hypothetical protein AVEN_207998-1 [Araneus ventricosus]|uniref:Uncharacterized protein n=1 Tax=Araneus ventricosus TaxID=182803 RepID=A0A4Y2NDA3_ARAVE|nr:hypothetical protein AVEN_207998-1 [Araneus ventricosus]
MKPRRKINRTRARRVPAFVPAFFKRLPVPIVAVPVWDSILPHAPLAPRTCDGQQKKLNFSVSLDSKGTSSQRLTISGLNGGEVQEPEAFVPG